MKLLGRKKTASSPKASKGKSFRRSVTPKKKRNDDGGGETTKPRSRSRSLSRRFRMRSSRKSKQKTSPPELISPAAVDRIDAMQEPEAEKGAEETTPKEEAPKEEAEEEAAVEAIPSEAPRGSSREEADDVAEGKAEEEAAATDDEEGEEEAAPAEGAETAEEGEEESAPSGGGDDATEEGEDAASANEEAGEGVAGAKEERGGGVAPTAESTEEASLEEGDSPEETSGALAKAADDYADDRDPIAEPTVETSLLRPRGEESVFDVGMHNVKLIVDGAMAQAMNLGAQGSELLGCCANTAVEDDNENNPVSDIVATEADSKTRGATTPADPNQSIFLQPELLGKAKDMWEQARTKVEETYTEASSSWMDSNTYSTLENKAANQGPSLPVGCITEETEETDDTREESEDPSFSVNDEGIRQGS